LLPPKLTEPDPNKDELAAPELPAGPPEVLESEQAVAANVPPEPDEPVAAPAKGDCETLSLPPPDDEKEPEATTAAKGDAPRLAGSGALPKGDCDAVAVEPKGDEEVPAANVPPNGEAPKFPVETVPPKGETPLLTPKGE